MSEKSISNHIKLEASKHGVSIFNNPVGLAWVGRFLRNNKDGTITLSGASRVGFGLMPGSADLIGYYPVKITQEHVGKTLGIFVSFEVKRPGNRPTDAQITWHQNAKAAGCIAEVLTAPEQVLPALEKIRCP